MKRLPLKTNRGNQIPRPTPDEQEARKTEDTVKIKSVLAQLNICSGKELRSRIRHCRLRVYPSQATEGPFDPASVRSFVHLYAFLFLQRPGSLSVRRI